MVQSLLHDISWDLIWQMAFLFARIGSTVALIPAIGERYIFGRAKIVLIFFTCLLLQSHMQGAFPKTPENVGICVKYLVIETIIGLILGCVSRIYFLCLDFVGTTVSMQSGLSAASFFDPNQHAQTSIFSTFFTLVGVMFVFGTNTHYLLFTGVIDSYKSFQIGFLPDMGDTAKLIAYVVNDSIILGFKIASPFLVVNIAMQVGSGILARLMPNLQVFFILTPVQILVTFAIIMISLSPMMEALISRLSTISFEHFM